VPVHEAAPPRQDATVTPTEIARWRAERAGQTLFRPERRERERDAARARESAAAEVHEVDLDLGNPDMPRPPRAAAPAPAPEPDAPEPRPKPRKERREERKEERREAPAPEPQEDPHDGADDAHAHAPHAHAAHEDDAPAFVREVRRRAFWQSARVRALLWLLLVLLAAGLALQVALSRRDWLAAAYPSTEPALRLLCRVAGCAVGPYRHLDGMVVESSSFTRAGDNVYQLTVTLRNNAALPVAMPALDLTLNNTQGQPVLRRVITPAELGAPDRLAAGGEFAGAARLTLASLPDGAAVTGYRVEAFYP